MNKFSEFSGSQKILAGLLRRYVGCGQLYSVEEFAHRCGITASAVYSARLGNVGLETTRVILDNLPPECWTEFLAHWGFPHAVRITDVDGDHHEAGRELAGATSDYVDAASDGVIDHIEDRKLTQRYHRVIAALSKLTTPRCTERAAR